MLKTWGGESPVLEVAPAGVSKDTGLDVLRKAYDIKRDDIYAFGDEMNDFEMIGYAMALHEEWESRIKGHLWMI